jgi:hypothetical protein
MKTINKIGTSILGLLALNSIDTKAQNFFDGMPGPTGSQIESRLNYNATNNQFNGMGLLKTFTNFGENSKILGVLPIGFDANGPDPKGINLGYMMEKIDNQDLYMVSAIGAFKGSTGTLTNLSPQLYLTAIMNSISIDASGSLNYDLSNQNLGMNSSITLGYGNEMTRFGASLVLEKNNDPNTLLHLRKDFTINGRKHALWGTLTYDVNNNIYSIGVSYNPQIALKSTK